MYKIASQFEEAAEVISFCAVSGECCNSMGDPPSCANVLPDSLWTRSRVVIADHSKCRFNGDYARQKLVDSFR
jgi:hypothetical protein